MLEISNTKIILVVFYRGCNRYFYRILKWKFSIIFEQQIGRNCFDFPVCVIREDIAEINSFFAEKSVFFAEINPFLAEIMP